MTMMAAPTTRGRQRWPLMALLLGVFLLSSCQQSQPSRQAALQVREVYRFEALPELVATSDVVVVGTLTSLQERTVGAPEEEIRYLDAKIAVQSILKASLQDSVVTVSTRELAYPEPHVEWRKPGSVVVLFLSSSRDVPGTRYHPVNQSQSVFVLAAGERLRPTVDDPLARRIGAMTLPELVAEIEKAKAAIERGEVVPQRARGRA